MTIQRIPRTCLCALMVACIASAQDTEPERDSAKAERKQVQNATDGKPQKQTAEEKAAEVTGPGKTRSAPRAGGGSKRRTRLLKLQQLRRDYHVTRRAIVDREQALREKHPGVKDKIAAIDDTIQDLHTRIRQLEDSKAKVYADADADLKAKYRNMDALQRQIEALRSDLYPITTRKPAKGTAQESQRAPGHGFAPKPAGRVGPDAPKKDGDQPD